ncbi:metallopeptidase family protein, partial [Acidobacteria bacterium AH-259-A15]|nr:metallopeptidase family protein [Acidobacteria bacterium AH-259-A15]
MNSGKYKDWLVAAGMKVSMSRFRDLVARALDDLPPRFRQHMDNVDVVVEDFPPAELRARFKGLLLGLYQGVPLPNRSSMAMRLPDKISIYKRNIERICSTEEEIYSQVQATVMHE